MTQARVATWKRLLGWLALLISIGLGVWLGFFLMGGTGAAAAPEVSDEEAACFVVVMPVAGVFFLIVGAVVFAFCYVTNGLTFTFDKGPVWPGFKLRLWLLNIIVQTCLVVGCGLLSSTVAGPILLAFGVRGSGAFIYPSLFCGLIVYLALLPFHFWAGLEVRLVLRSLAAKGLGEPAADAVVLGVSDADKSAFRKFFAPQDDVGGLSMEHQQLVFQGEKHRLRIALGDLRVGREGDAGNTTGLFGVGHVVLRYAAENGENAVRLHPIGDFTIWRYQKASDALEGRIREWLAAAATSPSLDR